jgi:HSP20 family protein
MSEVNVMKQPKPATPELKRLPVFESPFFGSRVFNMNPFALMRQFTDDMDHFLAPAPKAATNGATWFPVIEVREKEGKFLVTAELPGLKKEDVKVHIDGDTLILEGERKEEKEEKRAGYYHTERSYGTFFRSITLPEGAKADLTAAQFNNGILEVTVPVPELKAKRQDIPVLEGVKKVAAV